MDFVDSLAATVAPASSFRDLHNPIEVSTTIERIDERLVAILMPAAPRQSRLAKDLRIRPPQIMPIKQSQVSKLPCAESAATAANRVAARWEPQSARSSDSATQPNQHLAPPRRRPQFAPANG